MVLYAHEANVNLNSTHTGLGMSLVVLSALIFSFYVVYSKALINRLGSRLFTSIICHVKLNCICGFALCLNTNISNLHINHAAIIYALLLAIFSTVLPSFMMTEAIARIGTYLYQHITVAIKFIITIGLAIICLDEPFGLYHLLGIALVYVRH